MQVQNTGDIKLNGIKALIYGRTGAQKTRQILALQNAGFRPIVISTDNGLLSLSGASVPYLSVTTYEQFLEAFNFLGKPENQANYDVICIDDISELAKIVVTVELAKTSKSGNKVNGQAAYGEMQTKIEAVVNNLLNVQGKHVLVIAKEERISDSMTGSVMHTSKFEGKALRDYVPYKFDFFLRCYTVVSTDPANPHNIPQFQTSQSDTHEAKDRTGKLAPIEYGDLGHLFQKVLA